MGKRSDCAQNSAESVTKRQALSQRVPLPCRAMVKNVVPLVLMIGLCVAAYASCVRSAVASGYAEEVIEIERVIATLTEQTLTPDEFPHCRLRLAHSLFRRASLTGEFIHFYLAERAIEAARHAGEPKVDCEFLKASFDLKLHRVVAAADTMEQLAYLSEVPEIAALQADILLQQGRVEEAAAIYNRLLTDDCTWDISARVAWLSSRQGDPASADRLYAAAQDRLTAKEMRTWAWLELQRGVLNLEGERPSEALTRFENAHRVYPGYWLIEEHIAEALLKLGRTEEAIEIYQTLIDRCRHPEHIGALAMIEQRNGSPAATKHFVDARALFVKQRLMYPEAAVGHFLEYLIELPGEPDSELGELADENLRLRPNPDAMLLKARACVRFGETAAASDLVSAARNRGWRGGHVDAVAESLR